MPHATPRPWSPRIFRAALLAASATFGLFAVPFEPITSVAESQGAKATPSASAETDEKTARAYFAAGDGHYRAGRFEEAAADFLKAYALSKKPALLLNAYFAYRDLGDDERAAAALRQYLAEEKDVDDRATLEGRLAGHEKRVAERRELERQAAERLEAQRRAEEEARQTKLAQAEARKAEDAGPGVWPWVLVGVGGAAVVGGVVSAVVASGKHSDLEEACPGDVCPAGVDLADRRSDVKLFAGLADGLLFGGAALAGAGLVWWLLSGSGETEAAGADAGRAQFTGGCLKAGCFVGAQGSF